MPFRELHIGPAQVRDKRNRGVELVELATQPRSGKSRVVAVAPGHPLGDNLVRVRMQSFAEQGQHLVFATSPDTPRSAQPDPTQTPADCPRPGNSRPADHLPSVRVLAGHLPGQVHITVARMQDMHGHVTDVAARARCPPPPRPPEYLTHTFVCIRTSIDARGVTVLNTRSRGRPGAAGRVREERRQRRELGGGGGWTSRGVPPGNGPPGARAVLALGGGQCGDRRGWRDRGGRLRALRVAPVGDPLRDDGAVCLGGYSVVGAEPYQGGGVR